MTQRSTVPRPTKRKVIMPRDIELALKRLVLPGSAYWTRDNLPE
eukprot:COSAG01_NODE_56370_length_318_cov_217.342466_1_plen_43_part_10